MLLSARNRFLAFLITRFKVEPGVGLGKGLFEALSELTPMINIELIASDSKGRVALIYRDDEFYGPGWHLPGGVLRFKENLAERVRKTAFSEVGCKKMTNLVFLDHFEVFAENRNKRGHFISFLFSGCDVILLKLPNFENEKDYKNGDIAMFSTFPKDVIPQHEKYKTYVEKILKV